MKAIPNITSFTEGIDLMETLTVATVVNLLQKLYGLGGEINPLPGEYDANYHLRSLDGAQYVLKILHPDRRQEDVDLLVAALQYVAQTQPDLLLPRVVLTTSGTAVTLVELTKAASSDLEIRVHPSNESALGLENTSRTGRLAYVFLLTYIPGKVYAQVKPQLPALRQSLGLICGQISHALRDFQHPHAARWHKWDGAQAAWITGYLPEIEDSRRRAIVASHLSRFLELLPALNQTRRQPVHGDGNDYNILVDQSDGFPGQVYSVIDFGDLVETHLVCDVAVACAYALLDQPDPLAAAADVLRGYHQAFPLTEDEIALLFPLICMRLSVSVTNAAYRKQTEDDPYIVISERPAWDALEKLQGIHPRFAYYVLRAACGYEPVPHSRRVREYLTAQAACCSPLLGVDLRTTPLKVLDLSVSSLLLGADPENASCTTLSRLLEAALLEAGVEVGIGRYDEARLIYASDLFATGSNPTSERRTIHIGLDVWITQGSPLYAPLAGIVELVAENPAPLDYGPLLILRHQTTDGDPFYTLYGHLAPDVLTRWNTGDTVEAGDLIAHVGAESQNGHWPPHVHFQIITDLLAYGRDFPGVALASQRDVWLSLSPDPNALLAIPPEHFPVEQSYDATLTKRRSRLGGNLSLSYRNPLKIVRGWRQYLYDEAGRAYLDMYNNVPHVGHTHPDVVQAIQKQSTLLTTNTRYLHDNVLIYAERLCARLPPSLEVCFFVNSASEANELGLRLARTYTGSRDLIVMDAAYHGHTTSLIDISPYKFNGKGGQGKVDWVHVAPIPDDYRGVYKRDDPERGAKYAAEVEKIINQLQAQGRGLAGFIAESLPSVGGQIIPPPGYLSTVYAYVRAAGGICIADEVQVGFGRLGDYFWGFELDHVVPDIVVCGKPIGNGYPLGAVITTRAIADAFNNGMEFFSTFGGNPVACAAGLAVLDVLEKENLPANAASVGHLLLEGMQALMEQYAIIGDVRGIGLFLGVELVKDRQTLAPAAAQAGYIVNRLRDHSILAGTDGPLHNVIKLRPAMIFSTDEARFFLNVFDSILREDGAQPQP